MNSSNILPFKDEINRKIIHLSSSIIPIFYFFNSFLSTVILVSLLLLAMFLIEFLRHNNNFISKIFYSTLGTVVREYENKDLMSATYLVISTLFTILFFDKNIAILSILILTICDSAAAIFGMKYGKITIFNNKTIEGSVSFCLTGFIILFFYYFFLDLNSYFIYGFLAIIVITVIEHITPTKFDNLAIPIISSILFTIIDKL